MLKKGTDRGNLPTCSTSEGRHSAFLVLPELGNNSHMRGNGHSKDYDILIGFL